MVRYDLCITVVTFGSGEEYAVTSCSHCGLRVRRVSVISHPWQVRCYELLSLSAVHSSCHFDIAWVGSTLLRAALIVTSCAENVELVRIFVDVSEWMAYLNEDARKRGWYTTLQAEEYIENCLDAHAGVKAAGSFKAEQT